MAEMARISNVGYLEMYDGWMLDFLMGYGAIFMFRILIFLPNISTYSGDPTPRVTRKMEHTTSDDIRSRGYYTKVAIEKRSFLALRRQLYWELR